MPGLGGSSRDDARPFIYPNMKGMGEREKAMRAKAEHGKAAAAQKKAMKLESRAKRAFQSGATSLGYVLSAKAKDKRLAYETASFRLSRYNK